MNVATATAQRMVALDRANAIRKNRSKVLEKLRAGGDIAQALESEWMASCPLHRIIENLPWNKNQGKLRGARRGKKRREFLTYLLNDQYLNGARRVQDLTERQKRLFVREVHARFPYYQER